MSIEVNGAAILTAMVRNPAAFSMSKAQVDAVATAAVRSKLRDKDLSLSTLRSMANSIGHRDFSTIIGGLPAKDAKSVVKLDARHSDYETADEHWYRSQIIKLAKGEVEPASAPAFAKPQRTKSASNGSTGPQKTDTKLPKIGKIMESEAQATAGRARRQRAR